MLVSLKVPIGFPRAKRRLLRRYKASSLYFFLKPFFSVCYLTRGQASPLEAKTLEVKTLDQD